MPSRRQFLAAATGGVMTGIAGCGTATDRSTTGSTPTTGADATQTTAGDPAVQARLEREAYWLRGVDLPASIAGLPEEDIVALPDLDQPTRDAVATAITDGRFATSDPSTALLDGIDDVTFVEYRGTYYDISHTFPTFTLRFDEVAPASAPDDRTVELDSEVVESDEMIEEAIYTVAPFGTHNPIRPYTTTRLSDPLREFLARYDYVRSGDMVGELVLSTTERTPPHTVTATEATDEQLYGRPVLEYDSFTPKSRDLIRRTLDDERKTPLSHQDTHHSIFPSDIPDRLDRRLDHESYFVRVDGTIFGFSARHLHWEDLPVEIAATAIDDSVEDSPARIELRAKNTGTRSVELAMPGIAPFGVLVAYGPGGEHYLWTPEYDRSDVVRKYGDPVPETRDEFTLGEGNRVATTYQFGRDGRVEPGEYQVPGFVWARWPTAPGQERHDWRSEIFPYTLTLAVE